MSDTGHLSDGYHTFDELYEHRFALYIALCKALDRGENEVVSGYIWRSLTHSDGTRYEGWFLLCIDDRPGFQISYHLPMSKWELTDFATTLERAPAFDGHTSADVLERIAKL